ncbi:hypothetical protein ES705_29091 [subsurface metagenome]
MAAGAANINLVLKSLLFNLINEGVSKLFTTLSLATCAGANSNAGTIRVTLRKYLLP